MQIEMSKEEQRRRLGNAIAVAAFALDEEFRRLQTLNIPEASKEAMKALLTEEINKTYALFGVIGEEE
jgi:hypothetical protein